MTNVNMTTKETTIEYFIPPTKKQRGFLFALLREVAKVRGVTDRKTAGNRMRKELIEWGYIEKSRSELDFGHANDVIDRKYKVFRKTWCAYQTKKSYIT